MALTPINNGDLADATVVYGNFQYLDGRITATNTTVVNMEASVQSTLQSTLSIYQDVVKPKNSFDLDATEVTSGDCYIKANSVVAFTPTGNVTFVLPTITDNTKFYQILVKINLTDEYTIDVGTTCFFNSISPTFVPGIYNVIFEYNAFLEEWVCGAIPIGEVS